MSGLYREKIIEQITLWTVTALVKKLLKMKIQFTHNSGSDKIHTYCSLEVNSTLFFLSEGNIWWFLVEPGNKMQHKSNREQRWVREKESKMMSYDYKIFFSALRSHSLACNNSWIIGIGKNNSHSYLIYFVLFMLKMEWCILDVNN